MTSLCAFGERLRSWRKRRGFSQLDLALSAGTTPRYVSFIETGRSRPGKGVVLRLAEALDLPLRDRNALLVSAGLPPAFPQSAISDTAMAPVARIIDNVLQNHDPYPACLMGPGMTFLKLNKTASLMFPEVMTLSPLALIDQWFGPGPGRDAVENWQEMALAGVASLRQEMLHNPSPELAELLQRAEHHTEGLDHGDRVFPAVMCPTMIIDGQRIRTITTVMRFDKPTDVTMAELRIELMFPYDAQSEAFFRRMAQ